MFVPNFEILGQVVPKKHFKKSSMFISMECEIEQEKNRKKNIKIKFRTFVLFSVIYMVIIIIHTKFEDSS